ncbi:flavin reductase [Micromonospora sp. NPDC005174]|uniref:flavin reductase n=1 Tax=unclassified Micromonospora TaxID=2617518 RepID=UPI0033B60160
MTSHLPSTPAWTCRGCGVDWPCRARRRELRGEYAGAQVSLTLYLAAQLVDATRDLAHVPADSLYGRFLGWARRADADDRPEAIQSR